MYLISLEFIVEKDIYHFPNHLGSGGRIKNEFDSFAKLINSLLKKKKVILYQKHLQSSF